ncbi:hypothetical protein K491DRAFT_751978 [Lophiostoma macrostomum CBS 122681]|uniref:Uncharacterized protein n=1 Tax=Lophiostoma macrostomum CBS 122681 TaxID=1314788 RepID=A0A6A6T2P8_9PLEO|nr:hypothetical protein K491DRAFT_751978 [Lophiostoma macrostomum CBS 122681]
MEHAENPFLSSYQVAGTVQTLSKQPQDYFQKQDTNVSGSHSRPSALIGAMNLYPRTGMLMSSPSEARSSSTSIKAGTSSRFVHSYSGTVGSEACKYLSKTHRESQGLAGGVISLVYLTALVLDMGHYIG